MRIDVFYCEKCESIISESETTGKSHTSTCPRKGVTVWRTEIPLPPVEEWKVGDWYPMPIPYFNQEGIDIIDGYEIVTRDRECDGYIVEPGSSGPYTFSQAINLCEKHNGRKLL